jgi:hypothetical protein
MARPDAPDEVKPFSVRLSHQLAVELEEAARIRGESVSGFIRTAVEQRLHPPRLSAVGARAGATGGGSVSVQFSPNVAVTSWTVAAPVERTPPDQRSA